MPHIQVTDLVYDYPTRRALSHLTFELPHNSVTALVGPNGAGKTTLLRCLAGLETPLTGTITIGDIKLHEDPRAVFAQLGYLHDSFGLYANLTIEQCLRHAAGMRGASGVQETAQVERTLDRMGLQARRKELTVNLSRGWKQRVGIAQAIIHSPEFLILDEPASGLDPDARIHLSELIRNLRAEGMTIIVSSHILTELEAYSTHMLTIANGKLVNCSSITPTAATRSRMRVNLLNDWSGWRSLQGAEVVQADLRTAELLVDDSPAAHSAVLKEIMGNGGEVYYFSPIHETMEDRYKRLILASEGAKS